MHRRTSNFASELAISCHVVGARQWQLRCVLQCWQSAVCFYVQNKRFNVEYLMMDSSLLLPPTVTPLTGIEFTKRLPCGPSESIRRVSCDSCVDVELSLKTDLFCWLTDPDVQKIESYSSDLAFALPMRLVLESQASAVSSALLAVLLVDTRNTGRPDCLRLQSNVTYDAATVLQASHQHLFASDAAALKRWAFDRSTDIFYWLFRKPFSSSRSACFSR